MCSSMFTSGLLDGTEFILDKYYKLAGNGRSGRNYNEYNHG